MPTRRRLLAVAGAVALAGCGDQGGDGDGADDGAVATDGTGGEDGAGPQTDETDGERSPNGETDAAETTTGTPTGDLEFSSAAFDDGGTIPQKYTADGEDVSPPLSIDAVPDGASSLALLVDDPDAPNGEFVHWLLWNVPADVEQIPEGVPQEETVDELDGAAQGTNGFGEIGYRGPAPPEDDDAHTYQFSMYAVEDSLDVAAGAERSELADALDGATIAEHSITGEYGR